MCVSQFTDLLAKWRDFWNWDVWAGQCDTYTPKKAHTNKTKCYFLNWPRVTTFPMNLVKVSYYEQSKTKAVEEKLKPKK